MDIVLLILKIFAVILIVLTLVLLFFLLFPFKYVLDINYDGKELVLDFKYSLLYFFLSTKFSKDEKSTKYLFKIFSVVIYDSDNPEKIAREKVGEVPTLSEAITGKEHVDKESVPSEEARPLSAIDDIKETRAMIKDLFISSKKMEDRQKGEYDKKLDKVENAVNKLTKVIPNDIAYMIAKTFHEFKSELKHILPKSYKLEVSYGIADPYSMGLTYAITAPLAIMGDKNIDLDPKFMEDSFKAHANFSRRMPKIALLIPLIRLLKDKRFRKIVFRK